MLTLVCVLLSEDLTWEITTRNRIKRDIKESLENDQQESIKDLMRPMVLVFLCIELLARGKPQFISMSYI